MRIVTLSLFRDAPTSQIVRWAKQIDAFRAHVRKAGHTLHPVVVEGDSKDDTADRLWDIAEGRDLGLTIVKHDTGAPNLGSCEDPVRLSALSDVLNAGLDGACQLGDVVFYVESDLIWEPDPAGVLVDIVNERRYNLDVCAPMIYCGPKNDQFYDIWAFRVRKVRFFGIPPYHSDIRKDKAPLRMDSVGSCLAIRGEAAKTVRVKDGMALVGWCNEARRQGYTVGAHPGLSVRHP